jgi:hypothetical protein
MLLGAAGLATVGAIGTIGGGGGTAGSKKEGCGAGGQPEGARHMDLVVGVVTKEGDRCLQARPNPGLYFNWSRYVEGFQ